MKYGFVLPYGGARAAADLAHELEAAGWDALFVWEPVWGIDAWVCLTAAAMRTERLRLGTMISPLSRMRPWEMAGKSAALDNLSNGRVILSVGLGAIDTGFEEFGEVTNRKTRAELLDESLDILMGLWRGQPFRYDGKHYHIQPTQFMPPPPPVQQPRIPIWAVGAWPREKSMRRALRCDGLLPAMMGDDGKVAMRPTTPDEVRAMKAYVAASRAETTPFDIVVEGSTPGDDAGKAAAMVRPYADAGATWWIEASWDAPRDAEGQRQVFQRARQGPPRIAL